MRSRPIATLALFPAPTRPKRKREIVSRESRPRAINGMALPIPKTAIVAATAPKSSPRAANTEAAVAFCLANPIWRLSLQTHKVIGIP